MAFDKKLSIVLLIAITFTAFKWRNRKREKKKLQFLLGMPSETHRHGNKTNANHGLWVLVEKLTDLKARLHWPMYSF